MPHHFRPPPSPRSDPALSHRPATTPSITVSNRPLDAAFQLVGPARYTSQKTVAGPPGAGRLEWTLAPAKGPGPSSDRGRAGRWQHFTAARPPPRTRRRTARPAIPARTGGRKCCGGIRRVCSAAVPAARAPPVRCVTSTRCEAHGLVRRRRRRRRHRRRRGDHGRGRRRMEEARRDGGSGGGCGAAAGQAGAGGGRSAAGAGSSWAWRRSSSSSTSRSIGGTASAGRFRCRSASGAQRTDSCRRGVRGGRMGAAKEEVQPQIGILGRGVVGRRGAGGILRGACAAGGEPPALGRVAMVWQMGGMAFRGRRDRASGARVPGRPRTVWASPGCGSPSMSTCRRPARAARRVRREREGAASPRREPRLASASRWVAVHGCGYRGYRRA